MDTKTKLTKKEAKEYILKNWNTSNGVQLKKMLLRYWKMEDEIISDAKKIFDVKEK